MIICILIIICKRIKYIAFYRRRISVTNVNAFWYMARSGYWIVGYVTIPAHVLQVTDACCSYIVYTSVKFTLELNYNYCFQTTVTHTHISELNKYNNWLNICSHNYRSCLGRKQLLPRWNQYLVLEFHFVISFFMPST